MSLIPECAALVICIASVGAWAQSPQVVCNQGVGHFDSTAAGVTVHIGAVKSDGFATRACEASLRWSSGQAVVVPTAAQVDIDVLGADLGLGIPVIAFIIRPTQDDWPQIYEIWTMGRNPRKLITLMGEDTYRAVDAEFNGQVAIWTTDASGIDGFDGLGHADFTSPPMVVLRLGRPGLVDVSPWYRAAYDRQIAALRQGLTAQQLQDFKNSDGRLNDVSVKAAEGVALRKTKAMVLEIVWAYLYSGRPEHAWTELNKVWPAGDVARARNAIWEARSRGIMTKVAKVAAPPQPPKWAEQPPVFEFVKADPQQQNGGRMVYGALGVSGTEGPVFVKDENQTGLYAADKEPKPISLWRPPPSAAEQNFEHTQETVLITIDEAGKVVRASMVAPPSDPELLQAAKEWKFIPASSEGKPVAYRLKMDVELVR